MRTREINVRDLAEKDWQKESARNFHVYCFGREYVKTKLHTQVIENMGLFGLLRRAD